MPELKTKPDRLVNVNKLGQTKCQTSDTIRLTILVVLSNRKTRTGWGQAGESGWVVIFMISLIL